MELWFEQVLKIIFSMSPTSSPLAPSSKIDIHSLKLIISEQFFFAFVVTYVF